MNIRRGTILVYDREARSAVVRAFREAGWRPERGAADLDRPRVYAYLSSSASMGDTPRYLVQGTRADMRQLGETLMRVAREGGWDAYLDD